MLQRLAFTIINVGTQCDYCKKYFENEEFLENHTKDHIIKGNRINRLCKLCNFRCVKGSSIILIIYTYDNFYHKRGGRELKNDDKHHNFFMVQISWKCKKKRH